MKDFEGVLEMHMPFIFREKKRWIGADRRIEARMARYFARFRPGDSLASIDVPVSMFG
jgi:hypothetical protein